MLDRCVCCGEVIPEGRMVCYACEHSVDTETKDNLTVEDYYKEL